MRNSSYFQLQTTLAKYHHIHYFLDNDYIKKQCEYGLKCYILKGLAGLTNNPKNEFQQNLPYLEKTLSDLSILAGYDRLVKVIKSACDWESYNEVITQLVVTAWFKQKNLAKEVEPILSGKSVSADILLCFSKQDIYC
jgi:hypothetical protein